MYPLGKQFEPTTSKLKCDEKNVIKGKNYRISIITDRVIRLEYSPSGEFVDKATQLISNRNLGLATFKVEQNMQILSISNRYFSLLYNKENSFVGTKVEPGKNLKITLNTRDNKNIKDWYYQKVEARNMLGNMVSVDMNTDFNLNKGLYSLDGFSSIDDSHTKIINDDGTLSNKPEGYVDIYVFMYDRDFKQAMLDYYKMTGFPELIPRYAFGNWWSRNITYDDNGVDQLIRNFERKKIPVGVMLFDHDWHYRDVGNLRGLKTGYTFNANVIKKPENMFEKFHKRGIRVGLVIDPTEGIYNHEQFYPQAKEILGLSENTLIKFDPLNPRLLDVVLKMFIHPLESFGADFFWSDYKGDNNILKLWAFNHYMALDSSRNLNKRRMLLGRNGIYGGHKYGVLYGGSSEISWKELSTLPFKYLNASNIGNSFWSHDVGGNHGGVEDSELYIRHLELAVFSPILRFHAARGPYYKREPWNWDAKTESIAVEYLRLRHRLIPYIYTEAYNYVKSGTPLIQPFYYNYMWTYDDDLYRNQYYFGSQLLVCPILTKKDVVMNRTVHRFFIPEGIWYDFKTGKKFLGNKKHLMFFKEEDYPVFAHAGSIIPLSNRSDYNNTGIPTDLEFNIFPGVSNTYNLYEDDGVTSLYKEGYFLKTSIDYNYLFNNYTVIIRSVEGKSGIVPEKRNYKMVFRNTRLADSVVIYFNNQKLKSESYIDGNDFIVEIKDVPTVGQLTINCKGKDIEIDAVRLINDDVDSILKDLLINTYLKEDIANVMFSKLPINKKRVNIRKLKKKGLTKEYVNLFLKLLDYISEV